jgi:hypothetical protein
MEESIDTPKLLLLRPSGMLCNVLLTKSEKDNFALDIYKQLRSYAGKRGFEVRRTCGSSGTVDGETDKNLLYFLSYHEGILPRLARGCVILRGEDRYIFCYAKVSPSPVLNIVVWDYSPPREGGQFEMSTPCIAKYPPIAEMIYLKSLAICILNSFNTHLTKNGKEPIARGPLQFENVSLEEARKKYLQANGEEVMFPFLETFNSFNHYSMVAYPVGLHKDHFKHGKESLENKVLFCLNPNFGKSVGRGGCLVGRSYVYALLDW